MPKVGVEPTLPEGTRILSPARLPVPPLRRGSIVDSTIRTEARTRLKTVLRREILGHRKSLSFRGKIPIGFGGGSVSKKVPLLALVGAAAVVAAGVAGFSGSARSATSGVSPLPSSSCGPLVYKGSGTPDYIVASDLPLQGAIRHQTV